MIQPALDPTTSPRTPRRRAARVVAVAAALALVAGAGVALARDGGSGPASTKAAAPSTRPTTEPHPDDAPLLEATVGDGAELLSVDLNVTGPCDDLDPRDCLLPFPNDRFTIADGTTDTGRRVHLDARSMPTNVLGKSIDPADWNRNDGWSPSTPILTYVPGLDLARTWGTTTPLLADLARSTADDAPMVLLDATTGRRHPFWAELDQHPGTTDGSRLLILRPAVQLVQGHRYVVALRQLRDHGGGLIPPTRQFLAYRDVGSTPASAAEDYEARRPHLERLFAELGAAGVDRGDLFLTWDFTVASERSLSERVLTARDAAFAQLGDEDLADGEVAGSAPRHAITKVTELPDGPTLRRVEGTITVPNFLTPQVEVPPSELQAVNDLLGEVIGQVPKELTDALKPVTGASPINPLELPGKSFSVPGSRFVVDPATGLPMVDPAQPTVDVPFQCEVPRTALRSASRPMLYGHGLLGERGEVGGSSTERLRERGWAPCAMDWWGMSFKDLPNVATILLDLSSFDSLADRVQQGFVNALYLGRALAHPDGLTADPAFRGAQGRRLVSPYGLAYDGNSQGGIMGGALTALAPDLQRGVLGVPGMGYSTLLNRSVDWEGEYAVVYQTAYPDPIDQQLGYGLLQMLWDRAESSGYAQHMTTDPLRGTPPHEVFLQLAYADHQVANVAAEVMGRTVGASLVDGSLAPGLHWSTTPTFGFRTVRGDRADVGSVLVYWYAAGTGLRVPPNGNLPSTAGKDPHGAPRKHGPATDQVDAWLREGRLVDVCHDACTIPPTG